jgi:predicted secreted protein
MITAGREPLEESIMSVQDAAEKRRTIARIVSIGILLFYTYYGSACMDSRKAREPLTITENENGDTVSVAIGSIFTLQLKTVQGTGYSWRSNTEKTRRVVLIEETVSASDTAEPANGPLGAEELQVFRYRAEREGVEVLKYIYEREWEKNKPPSRTFLVTVNIYRPDRKVPVPSY